MAGKILLVDDDDSLLDVCATALRHAGYEVAASSTGENALKELESKSFDLVLTDLHMPGSVDGAGVVRSVKSRYPRTEVIVLTAAPTLKTAIETLKDGASDYVIKPFSVEHLKMTVERCFKHQKLKEELSSERSLRQELESAYKELQKVEKLKESFLARISHELRTPLNHLLVGMRLLEEELDAPTAASALKKCSKILGASLQGAERLEKTIFDLLAFVDMQHLAPADLSESIDIESLCRKAVEKFKPLWEPLRLTIDISFAPGAGSIQGNANSIEKAFEHLVHNAIVFNREGGRISVHAKTVQDGVEIAFSDTGEGIPEAEFTKIFDGFYQIADYLTRKVQGLGLGLATTRHIVEAHGGRIRVSSRIKEGTTFTVRLPLKTLEVRPPQKQLPISPKIGPES